MEPFSLQDAAMALGSELIPTGETAALPECGAVCTDSRALTPGCVFVALSGPNFDGHRFVPAALAGGAAAAIIARDRIESVRAALAAAGASSGALIPVPDTLQALGNLARWHRDRFDIPVVGVTGSVGKTSTKEMIASILAQRGPTVRTEANFNNEIGLPRTLFGLDSRHIGAVVEMAMRGPGQIRYLAAIARPQVGVITNIGASHLELLGSREAIARAKAELLEALPANGAAVLPAADDFLPLLRSLSYAPVFTFGLAEDMPEVGASNVEVLPTESRFTLEGLGDRFTVRLALPGRHNVFNATAAAAAARQVGATAAEIAAGLEACQLPGMRMHILHTAAGVTVLDDTYNANPASMKAALDHLRELPGKRYLAVLGDMLELGAASEAGHRETGEHAAFADLLLAVGELARDIAAGAQAAGMAPERIKTCADAQEALTVLRDAIRPDDAVLVKASRAMRLEIVVQGLENA